MPSPYLVCLSLFWPQLTDIAAESGEHYNIIVVLQLMPEAGRQKPKHTRQKPKCNTDKSLNTLGKSLNATQTKA